MSWNESPKTFTVGAGGVTVDCLVKLSGGSVVLCTASSADKAIGTALETVAQNGTVAVALLQRVGTVEMTAAGVITSGAEVFQAANGKVQALPATPGTYRRVGVALAAASGDGAIIEVYPRCNCDTDEVTTTTTTTTTVAATTTTVAATTTTLAPTTTALATTTTIAATTTTLAATTTTI